MPEGTGLLFATPVGMAEDNAGNLYVADMGNSRIVKLSPDGVVLARLGTLGTGPGQFDLPFGVAVDGEGNLLVSDTANSRLQKFTGDFTFISQWGTPGSGDGPMPVARCWPGGGEVVVQGARTVGAPTGENSLYLAR